MGIPRKKPHFLKPLLPGFKNGINVPRNFMRFLKGTKNKKVVLKTGGRKWNVKLSLGKFEDDGWKSFCIDNHLQVGDFAVFRHEGNMVFEVLLFDPSACEKVYSTNVVKVEPMETEEAKEESSSLVSSSGYLQSEGPGKTQPNKEILQDSDDVTSGGHPHFGVIIRDAHMNYSKLHIPAEFTKENGLFKRNCKMILKDYGNRSWDVSLRYSPYPYIGIGWAKFREENNLRKGDLVKFVLVESKAIPVFCFDVMKRGPKEAPVTETVSSKEHPHFVSFIKPVNLKHSYLNIPKVFARQNALLKKYCKINLVDDLQRSWLVVLRHNGTRVSIGSGWVKFREENGLKVGDRFKFEMVKTGKAPVARFTLGDIECTPVSKAIPYLAAGKYSGAAVQVEGVDEMTVLVGNKEAGGSTEPQKFTDGHSSAASIVEGNGDGFDMVGKQGAGGSDIRNQNRSVMSLGLVRIDADHVSKTKGRKKFASPSTTKVFALSNSFATLGGEEKDGNEVSSASKQAELESGGTSGSKAVNTAIVEDMSLEKSDAKGFKQVGAMSVHRTCYLGDSSEGRMEESPLTKRDVFCEVSYEDFEGLDNMSFPGGNTKDLWMDLDEEEKEDERDDKTCNLGDPSEGGMEESSLTKRDVFCEAAYEDFEGLDNMSFSGGNTKDLWMDLDEEEKEDERDDKTCNLGDPSEGGMEESSLTKRDVFCEVAYEDFEGLDNMSFSGGNTKDFWMDLVEEEKEDKRDDEDMASFKVDDEDSDDDSRLTYPHLVDHRGSEII